MSLTITSNNGLVWINTSSPSGLYSKGSSEVNPPFRFTENCYIHTEKENDYEQTKKRITINTNLIKYKNI